MVCRSGPTGNIPSRSKMSRVSSHTSPSLKSTKRSTAASVTASATPHVRRSASNPNSEHTAKTRVNIPSASSRAASSNRRSVSSRRRESVARVFVARRARLRQSRRPRQRPLRVGDHPVSARQPQSRFLRAPRVQHERDPSRPRGRDGSPRSGGSPLVEEEVRLGILQNVRQQRQRRRPKRRAARRHQIQKRPDPTRGDETRAILRVRHHASPHRV